VNETLLGGIIALAGVILGHALSVLRDRRREAREDRNKHTEARREAYAQVLARCASIEMAHSSELFFVSNVNDEELEALGRCLGAVELVGTPRAVAAGREIAKAARALKAMTAPAGGARLNALVAASQAFAKTARRELAVEDEE